MLHAVLSPRPGQPQVLYPGDTAHFICAPSQDGGLHNTIQWWINESRVTNSTPGYVVTFIDALVIASLEIQNVHNGSIIQCSVNESSGVSHSNQLLLLAEGLSLS
jgi:hypothetical protein